MGSNKPALSLPTLCLSSWLHTALGGKVETPFPELPGLVCPCKEGNSGVGVVWRGGRGARGRGEGEQGGTGNKAGLEGREGEQGGGKGLLGASLGREPHHSPPVAPPRGIPSSCVSCGRCSKGPRE